MEIFKFTINQPPVTKKNSQRLIVNKRTGRPMILPSKTYMDYEKACYPDLPIPYEPIDYPVNVKATYYMPTARRVDLCNLHEALCDVLVKHGVVQDDCSSIIVSMDGSRVYKDKDNPRTEVTISAVMPDE